MMLSREDINLELAKSDCFSNLLRFLLLAFCLIALNSAPTICDDLCKPDVWQTECKVILLIQLHRQKQMR